MLLLHRNIPRAPHYTQKRPMSSDRGLVHLPNLILHGCALHDRHIVSWSQATQDLCFCWPCSLCLQYCSSREPHVLPCLQVCSQMPQVREHPNGTISLMFDFSSNISYSLALYVIFYSPFLFCILSTYKQCLMINKCLLNKWIKRYTF